MKILVSDKLAQEGLVIDECPIIEGEIVQVHAPFTEDRLRIFFPTGTGDQVRDVIKRLLSFKQPEKIDPRVVPFSNAKGV